MQSKRSQHKSSPRYLLGPLTSFSKEGVASAIVVRTRVGNVDQIKQAAKLLAPTEGFEVIDEIAGGSEGVLADTVAFVALLGRNAELIGNTAICPLLAGVYSFPMEMYSMSSTVAEPMVRSKTGPTIVPSWLAMGNSDGSGPWVGGGRAGHTASVTWLPGP